MANIRKMIIARRNKFLLSLKKSLIPNLPPLQKSMVIILYDNYKHYNNWAREFTRRPKVAFIIVGTR